MIAIPRAKEIAAESGLFVLEQYNRIIFYAGEFTAPETWKCAGYSTVTREHNPRGELHERDVRQICGGEKFYRKFHDEGAV